MFLGVQHYSPVVIVGFKFLADLLLTMGCCVTDHGGIIYIIKVIIIMK